MHRRSILVTPVVLGVLATGAVVAVLALAAHREPSSKLTQSTWTLSMLVVDGDTVTLSPSQSATIRFDTDSGQASGTGGCNTFGGPFSKTDNNLKFGPLRSSLKACDDAAVNEQETHYFQALPRVQTYHIQGTSLTLTGDGGKVRITFHTS